MQEPDPRPQVRTRLRSVEVERLRDGTCVVRVELVGPTGATASGENRAHDMPVGRIRAGAGAALDAMGTVAGSGVSLELRGVKSVRAFDSHVVIVAVRASSARGRDDLLGAVRAPDGDLTRGGTLAVLDALNRYLAMELGSGGDAPPDV